MTHGKSLGSLQAIRKFLVVWLFVAYFFFSSTNFFLLSAILWHPPREVLMAFSAVRSHLAQERRRIIVSSSPVWRISSRPACPSSLCACILLRISTLFARKCAVNVGKGETSCRILKKIAFCPLRSLDVVLMKWNNLEWWKYVIRGLQCFWIRIQAWICVNKQLSDTATELRIFVNFLLILTLESEPFRLVELKPSGFSRSSRLTRAPNFPKLGAPSPICVKVNFSLPKL